jgi:hypothetical protein
VMKAVMWWCGDEDGDMVMKGGKVMKWWRQWCGDVVMKTVIWWWRVVKWWSDEGSDEDERLYVIIELTEADLGVPDTYLPRIEVSTISDLSSSAQPTFLHEKHRPAELNGRRVKADSQYPHCSAWGSSASWSRRDGDQGRFQAASLLGMGIVNQLEQV